MLYRYRRCLGHVMLYYIETVGIWAISCRVMLWYVISCHIMSCRVISCHVVSCHIDMLLICNLCTCHIQDLYELCFRLHLFNFLTYTYNLFSWLWDRNVDGGQAGISRAGNTWLLVPLSTSHLPKSNCKYYIVFLFFKTLKTLVVIFFSRNLVLRSITPWSLPFTPV